jgi:DNA-binding GntR family transcriptional regulator
LPNRVKRKPRYLELADQLRGEVLSGAFPDGFPTESTLCARFSCSRFTVREALRTLSGEGLIERKRGSGTVIQPAAARGGALHQPLSNVGELLQYARDTIFEFHREADTGLPAAIEEQIGRTDTARWGRFRGIRTDAAGVPIAVTDAYVHESLDLFLEGIRAGQGAIFAQLERLSGRKLASVTQDIQACAASDDAAAALDIEAGSPVLRIMRCYYDTDGQLFEISASHHPGDRFAYAMHIEVDS